MSSGTRAPGNGERGQYATEQEKTDEKAGAYWDGPAGRRDGEESEQESEYTVERRTRE